MWFASLTKAREYLREIGITRYIRMIDTASVASAIAEYINEENCRWSHLLESQEWENERLKKTLHEIASYGEGEEVTGEFDCPYAAKAAREVLELPKPTLSNPS